MRNARFPLSWVGAGSLSGKSWRKEVLGSNLEACVTSSVSLNFSEPRRLWPPCRGSDLSFPRMARRLSEIMHIYIPAYVPSIWRLSPHAPAVLCARLQPRLPSCMSPKKEGSCRIVFPQPPHREATGCPSLLRLLPPAGSEPLSVPNSYLSWESDASTLGSPDLQVLHSYAHLTHSGEGSTP